MAVSGAPEAGLIVDLDHNKASIGDAVVALTPSEAVVLSQLAAKPGGVVSNLDLTHALYGNHGEPKCAPECLRAFITGLRRKLDAHGLEIKYFLQRGYEIRRR